MNWKDNLSKASFRKVPFHVETSSLTTGRRLARHEYPQRDIPYQEDMGRKAREYQVDAFIIGDDYMSRRDALIAAIEKTGPGQLIHPYYGTVFVVVSGDTKISENTSQGGMVKLSITFVEAGVQTEPHSEIDTEFVLLSQFDLSYESFVDDFMANFNILGKVDFVVQDALDSVNKFLTFSSTIIGNMSWLRNKPLTGLMALLPENLLKTVNNSKTLGKSILELVRNTQTVVKLLDFSLPPLPSKNMTPSRQAENDNRAALSNLILQAVTAKQIVDLATSEPKTLDDARAVRAEIIERTDQVLLMSGVGQQASNAIVQLRTDAIRHFSKQTADLPRLVNVTYQSVLPSVVIAHDFYGDKWYPLDRDQEMIDRNRVRHPGFLSAGKPLQLLSN